MRRMQRGRLILLLFTCIVLFYLITPILVVIPLSIGASDFLEFPPCGFSSRWYNTFFGASKWVDATLNSIQIAIYATVCAIILGTLAAFGIVKLVGATRTMVYTLFISPMIVPAIVMAVAFYFFFARVGIIRSKISVVIAHTVISIPFVITNVVASLEGYDTNLDRAARSLGANPVIVFFKITMPCIKPGMISGALFAFITSFDEVVITRFIAPTGFKTLPMLMFEGIKNEIQPTIAAAATLLIAVSVLILSITQTMNNRRTILHGN